MNHFDLERFLPYRLNVSAGTVGLLIERQCLEPAGISTPQWRILSTLGGEGPCAQQRFVKKSPMDKITVSRAVAALIAQGLVVSVVFPGDRRARLLDLTDKGRAIFRGLVQRVEALEKEALDLAGLRDAEGFVDQLARLEAAARTLLRNSSLEEAPAPSED